MKELGLKRCGQGQEARNKDKNKCSVSARGLLMPLCFHVGR